MTDHEREFTDDTGMSDEVTLVVQDASQGQNADNVALSIVATITAHGEVTTPDRTTAGIETEHVREIRYSASDEDGVRYVEIVDGKGQHVVSGMGEAADALTAFLLYLLPPDHPDYPSG